MLILKDDLAVSWSAKFISTATHRRKESLLGTHQMRISLARDPCGTTILWALIGESVSGYSSTIRPLPHLRSDSEKVVRPPRIIAFPSRPDGRVVVYYARELWNPLVFLEGLDLSHVQTVKSSAIRVTIPDYYHISFCVPLIRLKAYCWVRQVTGLP